MNKNNITHLIKPGALIALTTSLVIGCVSQKALSNKLTH